MDEASGGKLYVIELDNSLGQRRSPDRPQVHVGRSADPQGVFDRLASGRGRMKHLHGRVVRLRPDLVKDDTYSVDRLRTRLSNAGFTVQRRTKLVWHVYVIELDPAKLSAHHQASGRDGWVYVGETSQPVEERFRQHLVGARTADGKASLSNRWVRQAGLRLRPDLAPATPFYSAKMAKHQERELAEELREQGFGVLGGH